jgi:cell wall-associated NlpC family hydrolase/outer membrane murein-binding lipoprotein Lpp
VAFTRTTRRVRSLLTGVALAALIGAGAVVLPHVAGAAPGQPTIGEVTAKLDKLAKQNEVLAEQYNKATADVKADQKAADAAQGEALTAATDFDNARARLRQTVTAEYESASFSRAGALLTSRDGQSYLDALSTLSLISSHRAEIVAQIQGVHTRAETAQKKATTLLGAAQAKAAALDKQKQKLEADTKKFKDLLAKLTAAQQAAYARRNTVPPATARAAITQAPTAPSTAPKATTTAAQRAVNYAIQQVGKGYVFAGTGPDAFDCSGLTMMAWAQGGVSLPHQASEQYNYGTHVGASELQPGDLVFLYSPISHVEIMVGPDLAVSAADEALGVRYVHPSQDMQDFAGATRLT